MARPGGLSMLDPVPPLPDPPTPALAAYLRRQLPRDAPPTLSALYLWHALFEESCVAGDLTTAVQLLALPWAGRPLHHWLLEQEQLSRHLEVTDRVAQHPAAATLTPPERAFLAAAQADRQIYYLPPLPLPGEPETGQVLVIGVDAGAPPPPDVVVPPPDLTAAIGGYRLAYRLYRDANYPL